MGGLRSGQYAKAVFKERRVLYCLALLLAAVVAVGCGGDGGTASQVEPTLAATVSPTQAPATLSPTAELPTGTPTSTIEPTALPTATQVVFSLGPDVQCPKRLHGHLNMDKLRADDRLTGAVISEIDEFKILIEIEGAEFEITSWGEDIDTGIRGYPSRDLSERVGGAVNAVRFEC